MPTERASAAVRSTSRHRARAGPARPDASASTNVLAARPVLSLIVVIAEIECASPASSRWTRVGNAAEWRSRRALHQFDQHTCRRLAPRAALRMDEANVNRRISRLPPCSAARLFYRTAARRSATHRLICLRWIVPRRFGVDRLHQIDFDLQRSVATARSSVDASIAAKLPCSERPTCRPESPQREFIVEPTAICWTPRMRNGRSDGILLHARNTPGGAAAGREYPRKGPRMPSARHGLDSRSRPRRWSLSDPPPADRVPGSPDRRARSVEDRGSESDRSFSSPVVPRTGSTPGDARCLALDGYAIAERPTTDVVVVNTCSFIESAREESVKAIPDETPTYGSPVACAPWLSWLMP